MRSILILFEVMVVFGIWWACWRKLEGKRVWPRSRAAQHAAQNAQLDAIDQLEINAINKQTEEMKREL